MKELLEAGVHFGHQTSRWNPKMKPYIFGARNGIYILDLQHTLRKLREALAFLTQLAANGGKVLFVGTKRQAQVVVAEEAVRAQMYYVNHRWLGAARTDNPRAKLRRRVFPRHMPISIITGCPIPPSGYARQAFSAIDLERVNSIFASGGEQDRS